MRRRLLALTSFTRAVADMQPVLWYRFNESASPIFNYGYPGAVLNGTATSIGAFNSGGMNAILPGAATFNGTTSILTSASNSALTMTDWTIACLVNATSSGEGTQGYFVELLTSAPATSCRLFFNSSTTSILFGVADSVLGEKLTASSGAGVTTGTWVWIFANYSSVTKLPLLYRTVGSVVTEYTYGTHQSLTNSTLSAVTANIGNNTGTTRTFDGKFGQALIFPYVLTPGQMQSVASLSGVS